ncbi:MAG: UDP-galactopyranose mutase [Ignavibacteria bacterium]|jgi:UDP-galactopyranose mutase|nr:UDP-galactopyranose mutase [Ignavibacteria bacterium]
MKFDYIIVGAGISGCTIAEQLSHDKSKQILIIDKRPHIAGNCYDYRNRNNIVVQKYGPHIFHTKIERVWNYLSQFTNWEQYQHHVLAYIDGMYVPIPFNLNSIDMCFPEALAKDITDKLLAHFPFGSKIPILQLRQSNDDTLTLLANYIYEKVFLGYNIKQWGVKPEELSPSVSERLPIHISRDNKYFQDKYQGIPSEGYTKMLERMLDSSNIHLLLNTNYFDVKDDLQCEHLYFTGMRDEYFGYEYGKLPYRSLRFEFEDMELDECYQPSAVVNYPCDYDWTRITEFAHFLPHYKHFSTTIVREYPMPFTHTNCEIPYYTIPQPQNEILANKYRALKVPNVTFIGRLADYKYYDIDTAIDAALQLFQ